jgi:two-component system, response regulator PdtaR
MKNSLFADRPTTGPPVGGRASARAFRIVAADDDPAACQVYREALPALGYETLVVGCDRQVVDLCRTITPDLLVAGDALPGLLPGSGFPVPVLLVSDRPIPDVLATIPDGPVVGYLGKPVLAPALGTAVAVALQSAARLLALEAEVADLRQALADRKVIERAKGLVMKVTRADEEVAYARLRKLSSDQNRRLVEVAHEVITAAQLLLGLGPTDVGPVVNGPPRHGHPSRSRVRPNRSPNLPFTPDA